MLALLLVYSGSILADLYKIWIPWLQCFCGNIWWDLAPWRQELEPHLGQPSHRKCLGSLGVVIVINYHENSLLNINPLCREARSYLTHWGQEEIAAILQMAFSEPLSWINIVVIRVKIVPKGPIGNMQSLFQLMTWCQTGNDPLSEPMTA